ncbi:hypothetical protein PIROE2DRAFT_20755 [Piromyces sp. E2]|nr:hypothetical protein PIROE2DRAFT_20755 [Piromyces sp. E2]|eukprot:OUM62752.1 hypothetical protein PIROE2DRAFT_20755 [Piromyces sp. E2]
MDHEFLSQVTNINDYAIGITNSKINGFFPLNVFEKNIVKRNTTEKLFENIGSLYQEFNKCLENKSFTYTDLSEIFVYDCYQTITPKMEKDLNTIKEYYTTKKSIGFLTKDGTVEPLQTFDNSYMYGSSVHHTDYKKYDELMELFREDKEMEKKYDEGEFFNETNIEKYLDKEYVMYFKIGDNVSRELFKKTAGKYNKHDLIGQGIVEILKTLGWTEKDEPRSNEMYYVDENISIPEAQYAFHLNTVMKMVNEASLSPDNTQENPQTQVETPTEKVIETTITIETETPTPTPTPSPTDVNVNLPLPTNHNEDSMDEIEVDVSVDKETDDDSDSDDNSDNEN